jgi:hypothetical protein
MRKIVDVSLEIARRIREFDARSEVNVDLAESETVVTGQPIQTRVTPIPSL